jgi:hypothetical protein
MITLTSSDETLTNIIRLIKASGIALPTSPSELRIAYGDCLKTHQQHCAWIRPTGYSLKESLRQPISPTEERTYHEIFCGDTTVLDDLDQAQVIKPEKANVERKIAQLESAIALLGDRSQDHLNFLDLSVERIFVDGSDVAAGGTTSDAVGLVWSNPHPEFSDTDLAEFLAHEMTHTLMFLDEWLLGHYTRPLTHDESTWCHSAILKKKRPIDKVLHSIVVASEIVLLRQTYLGEPEAPKAHPPSHRIKQAIADSIDSIKDVQRRSGILAERALDLLDRVESRLH